MQWVSWLVPADPANLQLSLTILRHHQRFRVTHQRNLGRERAVAQAVMAPALIAWGTW